MSQYSDNNLIQRLINCNNFLEIIKLYSENITILKNYTILIFDDPMTNSINKKPPVDLTKKLKAVTVASIFKSSFCMLNETMCYKMLSNKNAEFEYKNCFDLDINMMNELVDFHNNTKNIESDSIVKDLNLFCNDVTCFPYIIENASKLNDKNVQLKHC